jgi:hypothetical protein
MSIATLALAVAQVLAACPLDHARYTLRGEPSVTLSVHLRTPTHDWPTDVVISIHSATTGATYSFLPYRGNGQGITTHLASTDDPSNPPGHNSARGRPLGDLDYLVADASYRFDQGFEPHPEAPAPRHLLMPGLQEAFWYRPPDGRREGVPIAFFDLTGCAR